MTKQNGTVGDLLRRVAGFPGKDSDCCGSSPEPAKGGCCGTSAEERGDQAPASTPNDGCGGEGEKGASGGAASRRWRMTLPVDQIWGDGRPSDLRRASRTGCACLPPVETGEC